MRALKIKNKQTKTLRKEISDPSVWWSSPYHTHRAYAQPQKCGDPETRLFVLERTKKCRAEQASLCRAAFPRTLSRPLSRDWETVAPRSRAGRSALSSLVLRLPYLSNIIPTPSPCFLADGQGAWRPAGPRGSAAYLERRAKRRGGPREERGGQAGLKLWTEEHTDTERPFPITPTQVSSSHSGQGSQGPCALGGHATL